MLVTIKADHPARLNAGEFTIFTAARFIRQAGRLEHETHGTNAL
jgi:hypothetical protein